MRNSSTRHHRYRSTSKHATGSALRHRAHFRQHSQSSPFPAAVVASSVEACVDVSKSLPAETGPQNRPGPGLHPGAGRAAK